MLSKPLNYPKERRSERTEKNAVKHLLLGKLLHIHALSTSISFFFSLAQTKTKVWIHPEKEIGIVSNDSKVLNNPVQKIKLRIFLAECNYVRASGDKFSV